MSDTQFFIRGRNKGNERKVILSTATLLVGAAPTKSKRIKIKLRMPLTGEKMTGVPQWLVDAMTFVQQSHDVVTPQLELSGVSVQFSDDSLFKTKASAEKCQLRKFVVHEFGEAENPDVEMEFVMYAPFSTALWKWCGQLGGDECWAQFTQVEAAQPADLALTGDTEAEAEDDEEK